MSPRWAISLWRGNEPEVGGQPLAGDTPAADAS